VRLELRALCPTRGPCYHDLNNHHRGKIRPKEGSFPRSSNVLPISLDKPYSNFPAPCFGMVPWSGQFCAAGRAFWLLSLWHPISLLFPSALRRRLALQAGFRRGNRGRFDGGPAVFSGCRGVLFCLLRLSPVGLGLRRRPSVNGLFWLWRPTRALAFGHTRQPKKTATVALRTMRGNGPARSRAAPP